MLTESTLHDPIFINTIGHTAGVLLFGFIIALVLRDRRSHGIRNTKLSILAAGLAFGWNIGSLIALGTDRPDSVAIQIVMTASFAVLSMLPAVLLQVTLQGELKTVVCVGYVISTAAIILHLAELFVSSAGPHQVALLLIAFGFTALTIIAGHKRRADWFSLACLLLFASSFPHFGYQHFRSAWAAEIGWHHIGIPVALIVLLQDYRFLLLDTFVRFLMNSALAAAYVAFMLVINQKLHLLQILQSNLFLTGVALVAFCLSLILFAHIRNLLQQWVGRAIFHRQNLEHSIRAITQLPPRIRNEEELIEGAACEVASHLGTNRVMVVPETSKGEEPERTSMPAGVVLSKEVATEFPWAEAQIPLRFSSGETRLLLTGSRRGRQRYLSEDLEDMNRLGGAIVEQVERFRSEELKRLAAQAELRALQAQINPHFLFNAFNTLYGAIDCGSTEARRLVLNLTDIFRYFLQGDRSMIALSEELRIIKAYLEIEALRLGDRLETELHVDELALPVMIPILSIQPLVENAVKHGVATKIGRGRVVFSATVVENTLRVTVEDKSLGSLAGSVTPHDGYGLGLANVRRRLNISYGRSSSLEMSYGAHGSMATLVIPAAFNSPAVA